MLRAWLFSASALTLLAQVPAQVRVEGRILGADARPLAGAVVVLEPVGAKSGLSSVHERRTDPKGHFRLEVDPGRYGLAVTASGCLPHCRNLDLKAEVPLQAFEIRLKKGGCRIQGRLLCENGHQLEDARVGFYRINEVREAPFFADVRQGQFDITLAAGDYQAVAEAKGQAGYQRFDIRWGQSNAFIQLRAALALAAPTPADPETLAWIKGNAIPLAGVEAGKGFADMQPLKALIGDATVVGLGEATHGTREFFQLKHRMLEFLATEMGFTVFAIESSLPEAFRINEYVLTGKGDPTMAYSGVWHTAEMYDLIRWMRAYNADPAHDEKLRFYGVDVGGRAVTCAQVKAWLDRVDPPGSARLNSLMERMSKLPHLHPGRYGEADLKAWSAVAQGMAALLTHIETQKMAGADFDLQRQNLRVLAQFAAMQADPTQGEVRDEAMATNLRWIQAREQGAKVVLWAHNMHITSHPAEKDVRGIHSMGWHLRQSLGKAYLPIGFAFREGGFWAKSGNPGLTAQQIYDVKPQVQGTLDAALAATGHSVLALDLRARPKDGPVKRWLESCQGTWGIGLEFSPEWEASLVCKEPITEAYDALLFVNHTTAARNLARLDELAKCHWPKEPVNLDFKNGLKGWSQLKVNSEGYTAHIVHPGGKEGDSCLQVAFEGASKAESVWWAMQTVDATAYRGKKVRLRGRIRTDGKRGSKAVLYLYVNCSSGKDFLDNMKDRPVTSTEWTEVTLEGPVAEDAVILDLGCKVMGNGTAWFDGIRLEVLP